MRDISEYYVGDTAEAEEKAWTESLLHKAYLPPVERAIATFGINRVVEVGCGSGLIPAEITHNVFYLGVDKNPTFLDWAKKRNPDPSRMFVLEDVRAVTPAWLNRFGGFDLAMCFAFLKHFGLDEWDDRLAGLLAMAPRTVFEVQMSSKDFDDGIDFHHAYVTPQRVVNVLDRCGHKLVVRDNNIKTDLPDGTPVISEIWTTEKAR
ncbi:MAG: class I SAM-dependent methyltransferase [Minisyncoccia bacterium]